MNDVKLAILPLLSPAIMKLHFGHSNYRADVQVVIWRDVRWSPRSRGENGENVENVRISVYGDPLRAPRPNEVRGEILAARIKDEIVKALGHEVVRMRDGGTFAVARPVANALIEWWTLPALHEKSLANVLRQIFPRRPPLPKPDPDLDEDGIPCRKCGHSAGKARCPNCMGHVSVARMTPRSYGPEYRPKKAKRRAR